MNDWLFLVRFAALAVWGGITLIALTLLVRGVVYLYDKIRDWRDGRGRWWP